MRRSSKAKWEKAFGFFIGVPTFPAAERQDKCKTKSNRDGSRNECRTKFHFSLSKVEINFSLHLKLKPEKKQLTSLTKFCILTFVSDFSKLCVKGESHKKHEEYKIAAYIYKFRYRGVAQVVERYFREVEAASSSLVTPT